MALKKTLPRARWTSFNFWFLNKNNKEKRTSNILYISSDIYEFLQSGIGEVRIRILMNISIEDLTIDEMHYPLANEFFGFQRTATGGQYVIDDGTSTATVDYDWEAGETVTVVVVGDGETMTVGVVQ